MHQTFNVGPRNIMRAYDAPLEERAEAEQCYGNVGCGLTWMVLVDEKGEIAIGQCIAQARAEYDAWRYSAAGERDWFGRTKRPKMPTTAEELRAAAEDLIAVREDLDRQREAEMRKWDEELCSHTWDERAAWY